MKISTKFKDGLHSKFGAKKVTRLKGHKRFIKGRRFIGIMDPYSPKNEQEKKLFMKFGEEADIRRKFRGKYIAFDSNYEKIVASGKTIDEVLANAVKKGHKKPIITYVPKELRFYI